jgi:hypothetical protein
MPSLARGELDYSKYADSEVATLCIRYDVALCTVPALRCGKPRPRHHKYRRLHERILRCFAESLPSTSTISAAANSRISSG